MNVEDEYAILSAVWIIACNDDTASITYQGLLHRLNRPPDYDIQGLVREHPELFRQGMNERWLEQWKAEMRDGKNMPGFIREAEPKLQAKMIDSLGPKDGFRPQFRAGRDAKRSEVPVIEWGLNHIERLRKARTEAREATAKSWQLWLVFATSLLGVVATICAAFISYSAAIRAAVLKH
jgi:hypothetical protein